MTTKLLLKRIFDLLILLFAHVLLAPIWVLIWIGIPVLIYADSGSPIFYRQQRAGKDGKTFTVLKFRTMVKNADDLGPAWTTASDPRITKIGRILRPTALDELPQIINIFKGEMSFVGPRALAQKELESAEVKKNLHEKKLKIFLLPKDRDDEKNAIEAAVSGLKSSLGASCKPPSARITPHMS